MQLQQQQYEYQLVTRERWLRELEARWKGGEILPQTGTYIHTYMYIIYKMKYVHVHKLKCGLEHSQL